MKSDIFTEKKKNVKENILVIGGAGFIGSHLVDRLIDLGHTVTIFDSLEPHVHFDGKPPSYLNAKAMFVKGDVSDYDHLKSVVKDKTIIFHQASLVGGGRFRGAIKRYYDTNVGGIANVLDMLAHSEHCCKKVLVASSMSCYGEGLYYCPVCGPQEQVSRSINQIEQHIWNPVCPSCGGNLEPQPTPESKRREGNSLYALTKKMQEDMVMNFSTSYKFPVVILRYFSVYGPRQYLSNPYSRVVAMFINRVRNDNPPVVYEDGLQVRDFISVHDVVSANLLAMQSGKSDHKIYNVGSGLKVSILELADTVARVLGKQLKATVTNQFRAGYHRCCYADISRIQSDLGYVPSVSLDQGIAELASWASSPEVLGRYLQSMEDF